MLGLILFVLAALAQQTVEVVVAAHDLPPGRTIVGEDLQTIELSSDYVPNAVLRQQAQAIGRVPRERILQHEFIREERLADPESGVGIQAVVPRGSRVLDIPLQPPWTWPIPGDRIDLVRSGDTPCTVASAASVLAVRRSRDGRVTGGRTTDLVDVIYVALSPAQVGAVLGTERPKILLRNAADVAQALPACRD